MSNQEADVLRCWKCRKYIANTDCLAKCHGKEPSETSQPSAAAQESCDVWHMNLEAIPEWVKCVTEKAQCTIGKVHCPFCEACLGGFNFVCNTKCSCGQLVSTHFCRSRTDYQPAFSIRLAQSSGKHFPLLKIQSGFRKDTCDKVVTAALEIKNQGLSYVARNNNGTGGLVEALCLEVRAPRFELKSKKLPLEALNQKRNFSPSSLMNDACTVKPFHRRSRSLDLNIRERLVLSPMLYETCSMGEIYHGQDENPPVYTQNGLQSESHRKDGSSFQDLYSSSADKLQKRFRVTSCATLLHRETERECDFEATGQSSGSAIADGSPFVMNLSSRTSAVEEEQYITPLGLVQPMSISFNRKLNKRERNKLKSLRRKQRRRERWLQKQ
ncbi:RN180 ligase, partial [Podargus strigoides]|nr:RN180 ligase [Podargus strigoides]